MTTMDDHRRWLAQVAFALHFEAWGLLYELVRLGLLRAMVVMASARGIRIEVQPGL